MARTNVSVPRYRRNILPAHLRRGGRVIDSVSGFPADKADCVQTSDGGYIDTRVHLPDYDPKEDRIDTGR